MALEMVDGLERKAKRKMLLICVGSQIEKMVIKEDGSARGKGNCFCRDVLKSGLFQIEIRITAMSRQSFLLPSKSQQFIAAAFNILSRNNKFTFLKVTQRIMRTQFKFLLNQFFDNFQLVQSI